MVIKSIKIIHVHHDVNKCGIEPTADRTFAYILDAMFGVVDARPTTSFSMTGCFSRIALGHRWGRLIGSSCSHQ